MDEINLFFQMWNRNAAENVFIIPAFLGHVKNWKELSQVLC